MKNHLIISLLILSLGLYSQDSLVDIRDSSVYQVVDINGTLWMAENLNYNTELSRSLSKTEQLKFPNLFGRFYHIDEMDSICPCEWGVPEAEDWIKYFDYLATNHPDHPQIKLAMLRNHIGFFDYADHTDLFSENNPLNLVPTGWYEGEKHSFTRVQANYWTEDLSLNRKDREGVVHVLSGIPEGLTHIHLGQERHSLIHTHKHNLNPKKERKLRRFMVRCVKSNKVNGAIESN